MWAERYNISPLLGTVVTGDGHSSLWIWATHCQIHCAGMQFHTNKLLSFFPKGSYSFWLLLLTRSCTRFVLSYTESRFATANTELCFTSEKALGSRHFVTIHSHMSLVSEVVWIPGHLEKPCLSGSCCDNETLHMKEHPTIIWSPHFHSMGVFTVTFGGNCPTIPVVLYHHKAPTGGV